MARGFSSEKAFEVGEIDAINPFNLNLVLTIPVGPEYRLSESLKYRFWLSNNGNLWDYQNREESPPCTVPPSCRIFTQAWPAAYSNAGLGWMVSLFGRLTPPGGQGNDTAYWMYTSADGAEHRFYPTLHDGEPQALNVFYARDNSYLRLKVVGNTEKVETRDGTIYTFNSGGTLTRAEDRFGNFLDVTVSATRWDLSDNHERTHTVLFSADGERVESIELAAFADTHATYDLVYPAQTVEVYRGCHSNDPEIGETTPVYLLTAVRRPDGSEYSMPESDYHTGPECDLSGRLKQVTLPTLGRVAWDWQGLIFPLENPSQVCSEEGICFTEWRRYVTGVHHRILYDAAGFEAGRWKYESFLDDPLDPQNTDELRTRISTPLDHYTDHFFSVHGDTGPDPLWDVRDFGLPFTKNESDGGGRYLSTREYNSGNQLLRRTYVRYERDDETGPGGERNRRLASTQTSFEDGTSADSTSSDFDGYGNYRRTTTGGNFGSGDVRTSFRRFNKDRHTYGQPDFSPLTAAQPWILDTFDLSWEQEGTAVAVRSAHFDAATGWLLRERIHRLTATTPPAEPTDGQSTTDVIVEREPLSGNPASERWYGGDVQPVLMGALGSLNLTSPAYRIDSEYQYGSLATTTYTNSSGTALTFKTLDLTIDRATGLPSSSRDTSLIATSYEYDAMGRLRFVKPESGHDGWTEYAYTPATSATSLAQLNVYRRPNDGGDPIAESLFKYDAFGRLWQEHQKMPAGTWSVRETLYNAMGWRTSVSEQGNTAKRTQFLGYDPFGRPGTIRPPDNSTHDVTFTYAGIRSVTRKVKVATTQTAETAAETTSLSDRQGRLYQVSEYADYDVPGTPRETTTTYGYDVGNRLVSVTQKNGASPPTQTQTRSFTYDQRGFLLSEQHPEKGASGNGTVLYSNYDARGHAGRKQDGPFDTTFVYDAAERLALVRESGAGFVDCTNDGGHRCLKTFTYGTSNVATERNNGRLQHASRFNHVGPPVNTTVEVIETYTYAGRQGRVSRKNTAYKFGAPFGPESWKQTYTYDPLGNVEDLGYPDCTWTDCTTMPRTVTYGRSKGWLTSVSGFASSITYHGNGLVNSFTHSNGVVDEQLNDPNFMPRPRQLKAKLNGGELWNTGNYEYDGAGNVKATGSDYFIYDRVSRVVDGHVKAGSACLRYQTYSYDSFGNLQSIGGDSAAPGRATPTSTATNRLSGSAYDSAGNLLAWNGQPCSTPLPGNTCSEYDAFGMVTRTANGSTGVDWRYIYTADDERFWAATTTPGFWRSIWTLRDLDGNTLRQYDAHVSWTTARDYVYRDGKMLATNYPGEGDRHLTLDHLGTPRLVTGTAATTSAWTGGGSNCIAAPADYDGDGLADLSLKCGTTWHFYNPDGSYRFGIWTGGNDSDQPAPADYDGDGDADLVVFNSGAWHFYNYPAGGYHHGTWTGGANTCRPAPADYDGDGNADLSLKCGPAWHFYQDNGAYIKGISTGGDDSGIPVPGDYDGDCDIDPVVFNAGAWNFFDYTTLAYAGGVWTGGSVPAPLDYDGDGTPDFATYSAGTWSFHKDDGGWLLSFSTGGNASSRPAPGNFLAGRAHEPAIFNAGGWFVFRVQGMPVTQHAYFPFGEEVNPRNQDFDRKKFTGHERDLGDLTSAADDLDYMHARFYNPLTARFVSTDTLNVPGLQFGGFEDHQQFFELIRQPQSWNRYAYTRGNPLKYVDQDGRNPALAIAVPGAFGGGGTTAAAGGAFAVGTAPLITAGLVGVGLGYAVNQIPGVSDALTIDPLSAAIANVFFASRAEGARDFINTKVATVLEHIGRYAPPDPNDPDDQSRKKGIGDRMKKHLEAAREKLKRLPERQRIQMEELIKRTEDQLNRWIAGVE